MTHARTQTLCVTHLVTHICPPVLLTQLYTSVMGLGAKAAGRRPSPDRTIRGALCCVWEGWVHGLNCNTENFDIQEHWACSCVSFREKQWPEVYSFSLVSHLKVLVLLLGQGLLRNHEHPQSFPRHVSTLEKVTTSLVSWHFLIFRYFNLQTWEKKHTQKNKKKYVPPLPASHCTGQCLPSPHQHPSCRKWSLQ